MSPLKQLLKRTCSDISNDETAVDNKSVKFQSVKNQMTPFDDADE